MKTFSKFFSGTFGVVSAIVAIVILICLCCGAVVFLGPIVFPVDGFVTFGLL